MAEATSAIPLKSPLAIILASAGLKAGLISENDPVTAALLRDLCAIIERLYKAQPSRTGDLRDITPTAIVAAEAKLDDLLCRIVTLAAEVRHRETDRSADALVRRIRTAFPEAFVTKERET